MPKPRPRYSLINKLRSWSSRRRDLCRVDLCLVVTKILSVKYGGGGRRLSKADHRPQAVLIPSLFCDPVRSQIECLWLCLDSLRFGLSLVHDVVKPLTKLIFTNA